jgi:hypothetical protein
MRFGASGVGKNLENKFRAREQQDSCGWGYHDINNHDGDMVNYNSDQSNNECNAFVGIPLIDSP